MSNTAGPDRPRPNGLPGGGLKPKNRSVPRFAHPGETWCSGDAAGSVQASCKAPGTEPGSQIWLHLVDDGQGPLLPGDVAAEDGAIGDDPEHEQRADGHQVGQAAKRREERDDGCSTPDQVCSSTHKSCLASPPLHCMTPLTGVKQVWEMLRHQEPAAAAMMRRLCWPCNYSGALSCV